MEGAISLHFLHFSFEVRRGSSRAAKSFHYTARRLDNNNKLDGSGADEKRSDRTNGKNGRETNSNIRQQPPIRMQHFKWSALYEKVDGDFGFIQPVCSAAAASVFIVAKSSMVRQDKTWPWNLISMVHLKHKANQSAFHNSNLIPQNT